MLDRHKWDPTRFRQEKERDQKRSVVRGISNAMDMELAVCSLLFSESYHLGRKID
jgi:hypothetical protein